MQHRKDYASYHSTLKATPGQLVFGQDMIINMNKVVDWQLAERKHEQIICNNIRENLKRVEHDYNVGDRVMVCKTGILRK